MILSSDLIDQLVKVTSNDEQKLTESSAYGTIVKYDNKNYVRLDGSDLLTPISATTVLSDGDRVIVTIKNHTALVTGNISSPSASDKDVKEMGSKISEFEIVIADKVNTKELEAEIARINDLTADNVTIKEKLTASAAEIDDLKAKNIEVDGKLTANSAEIENVKAKMLTAEAADIKYASIENLNAANAKVNNLEATYGEFKDLTTEKFESTDATIKNLDTKFANVDFSNIGKAAIEQFYATSGIIRDLVIGDQTITGELVGVTIKGDLIEGNTIVADKLVIKGEDGLYYKLNTNGESVETQQTEYNSIHGSVIQAKSITATKIDVKDLVAFGATIGGFHITEDSLYSGVKNSADNTTRGIYMDTKGQLAIGDKANYLKYYKDQNGEYQLAISAKSISFGVSGSSDPDPEEPEEGNNLVDVINGIQNDINKVRQEVTTSLSIESSRGNIFKNDSQAMVLTAVIYHGTERITSITRLKTVFGNSTVSVRWSIQKFNETSFTVISANDSRIGSDGFTFSLTPDDIENKVTLKCEFILNSLIKASGQITVIDVTDAYSIVLTSETYTFIGGTTGVSAGQFCSTEAAVYCGQNQCSKVSVNQSSVTCPTGISATVTNNNTSLVKITFKTTAIISSACEATIPIVVDGITFYKKFSFAVAKAGATGPKGDQGVAGKDGKDGATTYFHVKYSAVSNPTSSSQIGETPNTYIGTYVDFISEDSNDPKKYKWYRFQGLQGKQGEKGIPGENGANGETSYLHIKYSDDGGKTFTSKNGETMGAYIGTCADFEVDDPTTVKSYSWARIRGDQGPQGAAGKDANQVVHTVNGNGESNLYVEFATIKITGWYANHPTTFKLAGRGFETTDVQFSFISANNSDPGLDFLRSSGGWSLWIYKKTTSTWGLITRLNEPYGQLRVFNYTQGSGPYTVTWTSTKLASLPSGSINANPLQAAKTATNFMQFTDGTGLEVGNKTSGSWSGYRTKISASAFEILNRAGTTLAYYGDKLIQLGKNAKDAVIELCGGVGKILVETKSGNAALSIQSEYVDIKGVHESVLETSSSSGSCIAGAVDDSFVVNTYSDANNKANFDMGNGSIILESKKKGYQAEVEFYGCGWSGGVYTGAFAPTKAYSEKIMLGDSGRVWERLIVKNSPQVTSDRRAKTNIFPLGESKINKTDIHSELFDRLKPVQYRMIDGDGRICYGFVAQDVVEAMRELGIREDELDLVHHDRKNTEDSYIDTYSMVYTNLIAIITHELQLEKQRRSNLEIEVADLRSELESMRDNISGDTN